MKNTLPFILLSIAFACIIMEDMKIHKLRESVIELRENVIVLDSLLIVRIEKIEKTQSEKLDLDTEKLSLMNTFIRKANANTEFFNTQINELNRKVYILQQSR